MSFKRLGLLALLGGTACGPSVPSGSGSGESGGGDATSSGAPGGGSSDETGTGSGASSDTSAGDSSSTGGEPVEVTWCWSSTWTDAPPIEDMWTDGTRVLAAAGSTIVSFDGTAWEQRPVETHWRLSLVAARSFTDAWFGDRTVASIAHLKGETLSSIELPIEGAELLSLELGPNDEVWALMRPPARCLGICIEEDAQLFVLGEGGWEERQDASWINDIDAVGDTIWAVGREGTVASSTQGGPWTFVESTSDDSFPSVLAVSPTEFWILYTGNGYWHWDDGVWEQGTTTPFNRRSVTTGANGTTWWVTRDLSEAQARLERVDDTGREVVAQVPDTEAMIAVGDDILLSGRLYGQYVHRVSNLAGPASVASEHAQDDIGGFGHLFVPGAGEVIGFASLSGAGRHLDGAWDRVGDPADDFVAVWGSTAAEFWSIRRESGALVRVVGDGELPAALLVDNRGFRDLWGAAEDDVFAVGAPTVGVSGKANRLQVVHFDGAQWLDISPDVSNIGSEVFVDAHGVAQDLYITTAGSLHHYDGSGWESVLAPSSDAQLHSVRAYAPEEVFVAGTDDTLWMYDGTEWHMATDLWPELGGEGLRPRLAGNAEAGILLRLIDDLGGHTLWRYRDGAWNPVELPEGLQQSSTVTIAEDGSELWGSDGRRIWRGVQCED